MEVTIDEFAKILRQERETVLLWIRDALRLSGELKIRKASNPYAPCFGLAGSSRGAF